MTEQPKPSLIIAANSSPIKYQSEGVGVTPIGGLCQAMVPSLGPHDLWVGVSAGNYDRYMVDKRNITQVKDNEGKELYSFKALFLDEHDRHDHYTVTSNSFFWPFFHLHSGIHYHKHNDQYPEPEFDSSAFMTYLAVNETFADEICEEAGENTLVWLHDYHLLNTAQRIKEKKPRLTVGQFIHIPMFNSSLVKEYLEQQRKAKVAVREVVRGMLANDLLGFHISDYVDVFATAVRRFFPQAKIDNTPQGLLVNYGGTKCHVEAFPIGTDVAGITALVDTELHQPIAGTDQSLEALIDDDRKESRFVVVDLARLDYTKGPLQSLEIIDGLLERGIKTHFIGVLPNTRKGVRAYDSLETELKQKAVKLNQKWSDRMKYTPVTIIDQSVNLPQNYALLREADCVLNPIFDGGMELVFNETVLANQKLPNEKRGFLAFGNCGARVLAKAYGSEHGLVRINPYQVDDSVESIIDVINRKYTITNGLIEHVRSLDVNVWRESFLSRLREIKSGA